MRAGSTSSRCSSWLAILAMALNALWPLLANARPAASEALIEVCTAQGVKALAGEPAQSGDDAGAKHLQAHCALCSFGADKGSAPPATPLYVAPAAATGCKPFASLQSAEPRSDIRSPAHPRAPPHHS